MGTTIVTALLDGDEWVVGNVGDSRAYHYTGRSVRQVTVDHSLVQEMVDEGRLTREEAAVHIHRNIITRAVGTEETVRVDTFRVGLSPGDMLLLCSDGLNEHVSDQEIARVLAGRGTADRKVRTLIAMANKRGGRDNITVALAVCGQEAIH
jgi:protein phosphatase